MTKLANFCFCHRRLVLAVWCVVLAAAVWIWQTFPANHCADYQTPGAEATQAFDLLDEHFPMRRGDSINIVFHSDNGILAHRTGIASLLASVAEFPHVASVNGPFDQGAVAQLALDGRTAFAVVNLDNTIDKLANLDADYQQKFLDEVASFEPAGLEVEVTSFASSMTLGSEGIALVFAAFILLLAFGSVIAMGLPIITALFGLGIGTTLGACLTYILETPDWASTVATMIGLGAGVDYALLIVTRYRRALAAGSSPDIAVKVAMSTAGRSVMFAGGVVVLSLFGMATMQLTYINGVLAGSIAAVVVMLASSITLLPAILGFIGNGIDRFRIPIIRNKDPGDGSGFWYRWSRIVQRRPWTAFVTSILGLAVLTVPVYSLRLGLPDDSNRPKTETSRRAYDLLSEAFGPGFNGPIIVVLDFQEGPIPTDILAKAATGLGGLDNVAFVVPPTFSPTGDAAVFNVIPRTSPQSKETEKLVNALRRELFPGITDGTGIRVRVGGFTAISMDQADYIMERLPWFIGTVVFLSFLLLTVVFRSPVMSIKAGVMNLFSIAAAYGVTAYAVDGTWLGRLLDIPETPIPAFVPMIMFAVLFGLSMDYEVFLLSRVREEYQRSFDNRSCVADGLAATARVITAAAAIMVFVFGVFIFDPNVFIKQIGLGLTVAILVDATIVRVVVVPATMELLGKANWWLPQWLDRLLPDLNGYNSDDLNDQGLRIDGL